MHIVLVVPPAVVDYEWERLEFLGVGYLAAIARQAGHRVDIIDCRFQRLDQRAAVELIARLDPQLVGLSAPFTLDVVSSGRLASALRSAGFDGHIIVGGHPTSFSYRATFAEFPEIDAIVIGEGEHTFLELVETIARRDDWRHIAGLATLLDGEVRTTPSRHLIADLDSLPFPARDNIATDGEPSSVVWFRQRGIIPGTAIASARGCPFKCTYCDIVVFYGASSGSKWRCRSAGNVVAEMEELSKRWGINSFRFVDDNFFGSCRKGRDRAAEIARQLIERRLDLRLVIECCSQDVEPELFGLLRRAGVFRANVGIESGVARSLTAFNKRATINENERAISILRELDIEIHPNFILIEPDTTLEDLYENIEFMKRTRLYRAPGAHRILYSNQLALYDGTPMLRSLREEGRIQPWVFGGLPDEDQAMVEKLGIIFDYSLKDPRIGDFLKVHRPVLDELLEREQLAREWQRVLYARAEEKKTFDMLVRWLANIGTLAFQLFVKAVDLVAAGCSSEEARSQVRLRLFQEIDTYDRRHFGVPLREAVGEAAPGPTGCVQAETSTRQVSDVPGPNPDGSRADVGLSFGYSPVVETLLEVMLGRGGKESMDGGPPLTSLPLWNVLNLVVREPSVPRAVAALEELSTLPDQHLARLLGIPTSSLGNPPASVYLAALAERMRELWSNGFEQRWKTELEPLRRQDAEQTRTLMQAYWQGGGLVQADLEHWSGYSFMRRFQTQVILARPGASRAFGFDSESPQPEVSDVIVICPRDFEDSPDRLLAIVQPLYHEALHPLVRQAVRQPGLARPLERLSEDKSYLQAWKTDGAAYSWEAWFEELVVEMFQLYLLVVSNSVDGAAVRQQLMSSSYASNHFAVNLYNAFIRDYQPGPQALGELLVRFHEQSA